MYSNLKKEHMKKAAILIITLLFIATTHMFGAITIRYSNKDSKNLVIKFTLDGSSKEVTFDAGKTSSVTIQSTSKKCYLVTKCGKVEIKDGDTIEIKDGCIKIV
jgi:uncharacterized protein YxeA